MDKPLTQEEVLADLQRGFKTVGKGTAEERAAQQLLKTLDILRSRLGDFGMIKLIYLSEDSPLPGRVQDILRQAVEGKLSASDAEGAISTLREQYAKVIADLGIKPAKSDAYLF